MSGVGQLTGWALVEAFLRDIYGADAPLVWTTGFRDIQPGTGWKGAQGLLHLVGMNPDEGDYYFCIGAMRPKSDRRSNPNVVAQPLLIVDDIGTKVPRERWDALFAAGCPRPTFEIETSPGNWTYGWALEGGEEAARSPGRWEEMSRIRAFLLENSLTDAVMDEARYIRLPVGWNSKDKYRPEGTGVENSPPVRLTAWRPGEKVSVDRLGAAVVGTPDWRTVAMPTGAGASMLNSGQVGALLGSGALVRTASMAEPDALIRLAQEIGMNPDQIAPGVVGALCPNIGAHTTRADTGFAFLGGGLMHCWHASCQGLRTPDFRAMMEDQFDLLAEANAALGLPLPGGCRTATEFVARTELGLAANRAGLTLEQDRARLLAEAGAIADAGRVREELAEAAVQGVLDKLAQRYVVVLQAEKVFDTITRAVYSPSGYDLMASELGIPFGRSGVKRAFSQLVNNPKTVRVENFTRLAGDTNPIVKVRDPQTGVVADYANLWVGSRVARVAGTPTEWLDLLSHVVPDTDYRDWLVKWMAYIVQNRGQRMLTIPVIVGGQGIGKDLMLKPFMDVIGAGRNAVSVTPSMLSSAFTGWMLSDVVQLPELKLDAAGRTYNQIKDWVSAGEQYVWVNEKYEKPYPIRLGFSMIGATNHMNALAGIEPDDRRWWPYESPAVKRDPAYYAKKVQALSHADEQGRVLNYLMTVNLTGFAPVSAPAGGFAVIGSKRALARNSLVGLSDWAATQFEENGLFWGRRLVPYSEVEQAARAARVVPHGTNAGVPIAGGLRMVGSEPWRDRRQVSVGGTITRVWAGPALLVDEAERAKNLAWFQALTPDELRVEVDKERGAALGLPVVAGAA